MDFSKLKEKLGFFYYIVLPLLLALVALKVAHDFMGDKVTSIMKGAEDEDAKLKEERAELDAKDAALKGRDDRLKEDIEKIEEDPEWHEKKPKF